MINTSPAPSARELPPDADDTAVLHRLPDEPGQPDPESAGPERPSPGREDRSRRPAFLRPATWRAFGYHWVSLLLAPFGLAYAIAALTLGATLAPTFGGLAVGAALVAAARVQGRIHRPLAFRLLGRRVPEPPPFRARPGFRGYVRSGLGDATGWRALAHMVLSFVTSTVSAVLSITLLATGLGCLTYWFWYRFLPAQQAADGSWHRGTLLGSDTYMEGPLWNLAYVGAGLLLTFLIWPAANNGAARLQAALASSLLGPTAAQRRMHELEASRGTSVQDADARLQRIERDLHDGTQAQLVAIAMKLGDARERLAAEDVPQELRHLLDSAHGTAKEALVDLRGLAAGIRPAALNDGLDTALESLAAATPLPVSLTYLLPRRPAPAVEAIAYFSAAELLNNVAKHAAAGQAWLRVEPGPEPGTLALSVRDDGHGGADPASGTGLAGLAERARTVDGELRVSSPAGGPTAVTVLLPFS